MVDIKKPCGTILDKEGNLIPLEERRGCPTAEDYPECYFKGPKDTDVGSVNTSAGWDGVRRIGMAMKKDANGEPLPWAEEFDPNWELQPGYHNPALDELAALVEEGHLGEYKENDGQSRYNMICRSNKLTDPKEPYRFFFAKSYFSDRDTKILLNNEYDRLINGDAIDRGKAFPLSREEGLSLVGALNLDDNDIACKRGHCIKNSGDGKFSDGLYFFTSNPERLKEIIAGLSDTGSVAIKGMTDERRLELTLFLEEIKARADKSSFYMDKQLEFLEVQSRNSNIGMWATGLIGFGILYHPVKDIIGSITGRVKVTDYGEHIRNQLKADPTYDIMGRNAEASQGWRMTDTLGYRSVIFDAPSGDGKDVIVEKMIIMKEKGDPIVPERFRKAKVIRIDAAEFQSGTKYRGTVADKVKEIGKMAKKGPVIVYISEIDLVVLSGGSSEGNTEQVAKLLQNTLDFNKNNLIVIGTTSRGSQMLSDTPDLHRRFNWPKVRQFEIGEVAKIINDGWTKMSYERAYGVKIGAEVVDAAAKLAEHVYRPENLVVNKFTGKASPMPRFDSVKNVLEDAAKLARDGKRVDVTIEDVIKATEARVSKSLDRVHVQKILKADAGILALGGQEQQGKPKAVAPVGGVGAKQAAVGKPAPQAKIPTEAEIAKQLKSQKWFRNLFPKRQGEVARAFRNKMKNPEFNRAFVSNGTINAKGVSMLLKSVGVNGQPAAPFKIPSAVEAKGVEGVTGKQGNVKGKRKGAKGHRSNGTTPVK